MKFPNCQSPEISRQHWIASLVGERLHLLGGGRPPPSGNVDGGGRRRRRRQVGVVPLDDVVGVLLLPLGQRVVPLEQLALRWPPGGDLGVRLLVLVDEAAAPELAAAPLLVRGRRVLLRIHGQLVLGGQRRRDVVVLG